MLFGDSYAALLQRQHAETKWGADCPFRHMKELLPLLQRVGAKTILDYGSGRESLRNHVQRDGLPYLVYCYDPGTNSFNAPEADVVACCDVLEHVEPELLDQVLEHLFSLAHRAVYLVIALRQAKARMVDGSPQHLIVQPFDFWASKLAKYSCRWEVFSMVNAKEVRMWTTCGSC